MHNELFKVHILENIYEFGRTNIGPIISMISGIALGQSETHKTLGEYLTDPTTVGLIKDYLSMILALGGFLVLLYNTFKRKKK